MNIKNEFYFKHITYKTRQDKTRQDKDERFWVRNRRSIWPFWLKPWKWKMYRVKFVRSSETLQSQYRVPKYSWQPITWSGEAYVQSYTHQGRLLYNLLSRERTYAFSLYGANLNNGKALQMCMGNIRFECRPAYRLPCFLLLWFFSATPGG